MIVRVTVGLAAVPVVFAAFALTALTWMTSGGADQVPDCTAEAVVYPLPATAALVASSTALYLTNKVYRWGRPAKIVGALLLFAVIGIACGWILFETVQRHGCF